MRYQLCPILEVYILVRQRESYVEVYRKSTGLQQERFLAAQTIKLDQDEIYEGIL
jgi:hypothetical protein